ncbi:hypothetical protein [Sodalinema gerasimenkoae]|uniref:hypothetical protein n=1 Tax=Sodalinema gerasimenkoae TaxID=2862348 RepID=UPI001357E61F|nr:hypothetical protein [Sodalinema gerasimenkoae]
MANINSGDMNPVTLFGFTPDAGFSTLGQVQDDSQPDVLTDGGDLIQNRNYTLKIEWQQISGQQVSGKYQNPSCRGERLFALTV